MLAKEKIQQALDKLLEAQKHLDQGNKRLSVGALDHVKEDVVASIHVLISEIEESEGKF